MKQALIAGLCTALLLASTVTRAWDPNQDEDMEANVKAAVTATVRASADADYSSGVAIFTQAKGGLMYEASVGGQKFKVEPM